MSALAAKSLQSVDSQMSLAAHARSVVQGSETRPHQCRVSRCGAVASGNAPTPEKAKPERTRGRASTLQQKDLQFARYPKGKCMKSPAAAVPSSMTHEQKSQSAQSTPKEASCSSIRQRRSSHRVTPLTSLGDTSPETEESTWCDHMEMPPSVSTAHSPTNAELTETVLQKSQYLLRQLSGLNLETPSPMLGARDPLPETESIYSPAQSQVTSCKSTKLPANIDTVEVPVVLLKLLADTWDEIRSPKNTLRASKQRTLFGAIEPHEACKGRAPHVSSRCSTASVASTGPPPVSESESDYSSQSPQTTTFELPATSTSVPLRSLLPTKSSVPAPSAPVGTLSLPTGALSPRPPAGALSPRQAAGALSPRHGLLLQNLAASQSLGSITPLGSITQPNRCRRQSHPAPSSQMVSITAHVPLGSSVSVSVTTSQTMQRTQNFHLMA